MLTDYRFALLSAPRAPDDVADLRRGFMDDPLYLSWAAKSLAGLPVTPEEHNAAIVALLFSRDCLAANPTQRMSVLVERGRLAVGWRSFEPGSVILTVPAPTRPGGAVGAANAGSPAIETVEVTEATRRQLCDWLTRAIESLKVTPEQVVAAGVNPGGNPALILGGLAIVVVGAAAAYCVHETQETARYQIRQSAENARYVAQQNARIQAYTARLNCLKDATSDSRCPQAPIESEASGTGIHTDPDPDAWKAGAVKAARDAVIVLGSVTALTLGAVIAANLYAARKSAEGIARQVVDRVGGATGAA